MSKSTAEGKTFVIVESPTKAKTIRKFLTSKNYLVDSCVGHVRDLPQSAKDIPAKYKGEKWATLGVNVENGFEPVYCVPKNKLKVVKALKDKLAQASGLILATDDDREGESISWHLLEVLKPKVPVRRIVFHEITKEAIQHALDNARKIDDNLVRAQEARRVLDRLVGYTLSPLIWSKVAYGLSAGRVQSVATCLISEKEHERMRFKCAKYWGLTAELEKNKVNFQARLLSYDNKKVATGKDFDGLTGELIKNKTNTKDKKDVFVLLEEKSKELQKLFEKNQWLVKSVEETPVTRRPLPPFITSTLQQEANRKLGLGSREAMRVAQKLYENGLITYMRTDSTFLSKQAIDAARSCVRKKYGKDYLPEQPRTYLKKKAKGAQEAHEAVRPAGSQFVLPEDAGLDGVAFKLYDLIWKRTVASQMADAKQKQVSVRIEVEKGLFAASGMTIEFPGFLRAYVEGHDDPEAGLQDREVRLPQLKVKDQVQHEKITGKEHETKPPARYTEASLVQKMEKEGIGRPSTYASIMGTIMDRGYVRKAGNALVPTFTALVVSKLMSQHLSQYVDLKFTSGMEDSLDNIADGELEWKKYLQQIYFGKDGLKNTVEIQKDKIDANKAREIILEGLENFSVRVGRYGAYICTQMKGEEVCASIPETHSPSEVNPQLALQWIEQKIKGADVFCKDSDTGLPIYVFSGRYGPYVQLGENSGEDAKPKRTSIPPSISVDAITPEQAQFLVSLPKLLGEHPETQKPVRVGIGRFGPYVVHDGDYRSITKNESVFDISFDEAIEKLSQPKKGRGRATPLKELGEHPDNKEPVNIMNGPYGPYVKCGKTNVSLPEGVGPDETTLEMALKWIEDKGGVKPVSAKKTSAKKTSAKKKKSTTKKKSKVTQKKGSPPKKVIRRAGGKK